MGIVRYISYILYLLSQILYLSYYLFISDCQQYILWQLIRGVDIWPDRVCSHGCFLCVDACHPCIIIFCYFLYITFVTWYRLSVGSSCMSLWFCWVESPSGSFLRSMGKLGLDWIGLLLLLLLLLLRQWPPHIQTRRLFNYRGKESRSSSEHYRSTTKKSEQMV